MKNYYKIVKMKKKNKNLILWKCLKYNKNALLCKIIMDFVGAEFKI